MLQPCALFLFNSSMYAMQPWLDAGIHCVTVDYHDTDHSEAAARAVQPSHTLLTRLNIDLSTVWARADVVHKCALQGLTPALVVSFPPCTDLAVCGNRSRAAKLEKNPHLLEEAVAMAKLASDFGVPWVAENPVGLLSTLWRKPDAWHHPYEWGGYLPADDQHPEAPDLFPPRDAYPKKTGFWCGGGYTIPSVHAVENISKDFPGYAKLGGKSARTKHLRSLTPRGWSRANFVANYHLFTMTKRDLVARMASGK